MVQMNFLQYDWSQSINPVGSIISAKGEWWLRGQLMTFHSVAFDILMSDLYIGLHTLGHFLYRMAASSISIPSLWTWKSSVVCYPGIALL